MWKYNYLRERIADDQLEDRCNALGEAHWDLRFLRWLDDDQAWDAFFKRTHTERDQARGIMELPGYGPPAVRTFQEQREDDERSAHMRAEIERFKQGAQP